MLLLLPHALKWKQAVLEQQLLEQQLAGLGVWMVVGVWMGMVRTRTETKAKMDRDRKTDRVQGQGQESGNGREKDRHLVAAAPDQDPVRLHAAIDGTIHRDLVPAAAAGEEGGGRFGKSDHLIDRGQTTTGMIAIVIVIATVTTGEDGDALLCFLVRNNCCSCGRERDLYANSVRRPKVPSEATTSQASTRLSKDAFHSTRGKSEGNNRPIGPATSLSLSLSSFVPNTLYFHSSLFSMYSTSSEKRIASLLPNYYVYCVI
jgi:hypothetical protein